MSKNRTNKQVGTDTNVSLFSPAVFDYGGEAPSPSGEKEARRRNEQAWNALLCLRLAARYNLAGDALRAEWYSQNAIRDQKRAGFLYRGVSRITNEEKEWLQWALNEAEYPEFRTLQELARIMGLPYEERN